MTDALAHRGPDGEGPLHRRASSAWAIAVWRSSTCRQAGQQPMLSARWPGRPQLQRRGLQLPRTASRAGSARSSVPVADRFRGGAERLARVGPGVRRPLQRHVRIRHLGQARAGTVPGARPLRHQAALLRPLGRCLRVRLGAEGAARRIPAARREVDRQALLEYFTFQNIFTDRTLLEGVEAAAAGLDRPRSRQAAATAQVPRYWDFRFREPDGTGRRRANTARSSIGCCGRRSVASWSATSSSVPTSRAASTRARSPRSPRANCPTSRPSPAAST